MNCNFISWLEKRHLVTDLRDVVIPPPTPPSAADSAPSRPATAELGLVNDHGFYSQVPEPHRRQQQVSKSRKKNRLSSSKASSNADATEPSVGMDEREAEIKFLNNTAMTTSELAIHNVIESEITVSSSFLPEHEEGEEDFESQQEAQWRRKQLQAQNQLQECEKCLKKFKKWASFEKHILADSCKKKSNNKSGRPDDQQQLRQLEEQQLLPAVLKRNKKRRSKVLDQIDENVPQPSPDSEVAKISQKLEAREAILNAKCPAGALPDDKASASTYSPSTNSVFSSPEPDQKPPILVSAAVKLEPSSSSSSSFLAPPLEFASGPPPKEARVTSPKKAIKLPADMSLIHSPEKSPNIFEHKSSDEKSAFNPFSEISLALTSSSKMSSPIKSSPESQLLQQQSARAPKRKLPTAPSHPYPILNLNPTIMVKKPLILPDVKQQKPGSNQLVFKTVMAPKAEVGNDGKKQQDLLKGGFVANVGGTQLYLIPTNNLERIPTNNAERSSDDDGGNSSGGNNPTSKLEQILRHGSAAVKSSNSTDIKISDGDDEEEEDEMLEEEEETVEEDEELVPYKDTISAELRAAALV